MSNDASLTQGSASEIAQIKAELAPSGVLRAGINYNNPLLARRDSKTGDLSGVAVDLSRQLAGNFGVPVELLPYDTAGGMAAAAAQRAWDIAFLAIDPARATTIEYTAPYLLLEGTYLVRAGSPLRTIEDVDQDGVRIAVTARSAYDLFLSRNLKAAQIVRAETTPISIDLMVAQNLDAVAAVRTALVAAGGRVPGSKILEGHFMTIPQAAGLPRGRPLAARYVRQFIEVAKTSGLVADLLKRHGLGPDDAVVAPAAPAQ
jgi:polar amino acid transport system substrate-binding protein